MKITIKILLTFLLLTESLTNKLIAQFSPNDLSNLQLWLSADNGATVVSGALSQWSDQSGLNNSCNQTNSLNRPLFINATPELNNKPCIRFDGTNDLLLGTTISNINNSSFTIFVVSNGESQSTSIASLFSINTAAAGFYFCRRPSMNKFGIFNSNINLLSSAIFPNTGYTHRILTGNKNLNISFTFRVNQNTNFTSNSTGGTSSFVNANYQIGGGNSANFFKGDIAEIIIYGNSLSENEM